MPESSVLRTGHANSRKHLLAGLVAVLFAISAFRYGGNPPEVTAAISIVGWWTIVLGAATGVFPQDNIGRSGALMLGLFLALGVMTALSISWAVDGGRAFVQTVQVTSVLGIFVLALISSKPASARGWVAGLAGGLFAIVFLAALSRYFPGIGDDVELTANLSGVEGRLSWPLGYWNATGACAAICSVSLIWFSAHATSVRFRALAVAGLPITGLVIYLTSSRGAVVALAVGALVLIAFGPRRRTLAGGFGVGLGGAAVLIAAAAPMTAFVHADVGSSADRQGLILFALTLGVTGAVFLIWSRIEPNLRDLAPWKPSGWQTALGVALALIALFAINPIEKIDRFTSPVSETAPVAKEGENSTTAHLLSSSGTGRSEYWGNAIDAFESEPLRGIGAGGFDTFYANNRDSGIVGRHAHSLPLQIQAELGVIGAALLVAIIVLTLVEAWDRWRVGQISKTPLFSSTNSGDDRGGPQAIPVLLGIAAAGSFSMAIDWTAEFPVVVAPVVIAIACIVGPASRPDRLTSRARRRPVGADLLGSGAILLGAVSIWVAANGFSLATNLNASRDAVADGDYALASEKAGDAIDALPSSAEPRVQLAQVQELQKEYRAALKTLDGAIERAPNLSSSYLLKARILLKMGKNDQARLAYEQAKILDPEGLIFAFDVEPSAPDPAPGQ